MSERTGLGPLEVALLRSVAAVATSPGVVQTTRVLDHLEVVEHVGPTYGAQALQDLGAWWTVPVLLFDLQGNWGGPDNDPPADPQYTEVRLSPVGELALGAEQQTVGPVPVDLVNGSVYRGGRVPSLAPDRALELLSRLVAGQTAPDSAFDDLIEFPTGGTVAGDLAGLYAGRRARMLLSCRIVRERSDRGRQLVITGTPPGVPVSEVEHNLFSRQRIARDIRAGRLPNELGDRAAEDEAPGVADVCDHSTYRAGTRVVVALAPDADEDAAERWIRSVWPVTVEATWQIPGGIRGLFERWAALCSADPSGLEQLLRLRGQAG